MYTKKIGDLATYINGYAFKPSDWGESGLPIVRIQDLTGTSYQTNYYDGDYPKKIEINNGDVLISWSASLGVYVWDRGKALLNQHIFKVVFDKEYIDKNYFVYAIKHSLNKMTLKTHGATMKHIVKNDFYNIEIPYPNRETQIKMSKALLKVENVIEYRKQQLEQFDLLIKSRFVEMFGDPISNPMDFSIKPLKQLSSLITNGNTPKGGSKNYVEKGILFIRSQNVWRNKIELDDVAYIDEKTHRSMQKSSIMHKDILITKTGRVNTENSSLGRAALYLGDNNSANINGHVYLIRLKGMIMPEFVIAILTSEAYKEYIRKVCVGGIDKRQINLDQVEDFPIIIPPIEQQNEFTEFVEQVEKSKTQVQKSLDEAQLLFNSLMQEYFG